MDSNILSHEQKQLAVLPGSSNAKDWQGPHIGRAREQCGPTNRREDAGTYPVRVQQPHDDHDCIQAIQPHGL